MNLNDMTIEELYNKMLAKSEVMRRICAPKQDGGVLDKKKDKELIKAIKHLYYLCSLTNPEVIKTGDDIIQNRGTDIWTFGAGILVGLNPRTLDINQLNIAQKKEINDRVKDYNDLSTSLHNISGFADFKQQYQSTKDQEIADQLKKQLPNGLKDTSVNHIIWVLDGLQNPVDKFLVKYGVISICKKNGKIITVARPANSADKVRGFYIDNFVNDFFVNENSYRNAEVEIVKNAYKTFCGIDLDEAISYLSNTQTSHTQKV